MTSGPGRALDTASTICYNAHMRYLAALPLLLVIWILAFVLQVVWWATLMGLIADFARALEREDPTIFNFALIASVKIWGP